ncbi:DUF7322 domain-containing protein [Halobiforma nitratireducens]|uniref:DUF7322 domain-containing protein n=1 Tax=Halobiforma nitratireducens JCM 10879 TaxID=1227454 RepID=M0LKE0_9EURY|nr:hypothetical protein [Halobiforma nitratireducens]EMA34087.1 hypothetical protein C446_13624 [Halobiforma nitratireducens JCM 10879]
MVLDRSDHEPEEPEEYDPEAEFRDPDSDSLTIPEIDVETNSEPWEDPSVPEVTTDEMDVPSDLAKTFWALVLVVNAVVLALSLGVMLILFEGRTTHGSYLIAGALVLLGFAIRRYRAYDGHDQVEADGDGKTTDQEPTDQEKTTHDP